MLTKNHTTNGGVSNTIVKADRGPFTIHVTDWECDSGTSFEYRSKTISVNDWLKGNESSAILYFLKSLSISGKLDDFAKSACEQYIKRGNAVYHNTIEICEDDSDKSLRLDISIVIDESQIDTEYFDMSDD